MIIRVTSSSLSQSLISSLNCKTRTVSISWLSQELWHKSFSSCLPFPHSFRSKPLHFPSPSIIRAQQDSAADKPNTSQTKTEESSNAQPPTTAPKTPKKSVYSMKKGQIVRVDKEKYLNSVNYLSVGHPTYYKGLDYIYEDRGEIAWVGIPTAPAWLPTDMLIKSEKLNYERL